MAEHWEIATVVMGDEAPEFLRENSGALVIMSGVRGSEDRERVGTVDLTVKAKRGEAWKTSDPKQLKRANMAAASPDMLSALKAMLEEFGSYRNDHTNRIPKCIGDARAAVAKAEGRL